MTDTTLLSTFTDMAKKRGEQPFLWAKLDGSYQPWSWVRIQHEINLIAAALAELGIKRGDRVVLVAENRPEWLICDLAILQAGAITVPAYITNTASDHRHIIDHSEATAAICSTPLLAKRMAEATGPSAQLSTLLVMEPCDSGALPLRVVADWQAILEIGRSAPAIDYAAEIQGTDTACFVYTSGTGGQPKGVMLSHRNILANVAGALELLKTINAGPDDVFLSFLPLSHAYEHTAGQFLPMSVGAQIYYAEGIESLATNLVEAKPTVLPCVPRLYEVLRQKIITGVNRGGGLKVKLFNLALSLGTERYNKGTLAPHKTVLNLALDLLVRRKVQARFGGRLKAMVSGGAPLNQEVGLFFVALGLPVLQGYGQTEAAPLISANIPSHSKIDTVGPPLPGVEVCIAKDGEILVRGNNVMQGYWKEPEATAEVLRDGWLHTGDIGHLDADGFLTITDRKKDIIVNSGGDNIAPQRIEGTLLVSAAISQALVIGDKRPFLTALLVPDMDYMKRQGSEQSAALDSDLIGREIESAIKSINADFSPIERIRRFHVIQEPFTIDNGLMTPTLKLRRRIILEQYADIIAALYRDQLTTKK